MNSNLKTGKILYKTPLVVVLSFRSAAAKKERISQIYRLILYNHHIIIESILFEQNFPLIWKINLKSKQNPVKCHNHLLWSGFCILILEFQQTHDCHLFSDLLMNCMIYYTTPWKYYLFLSFSASSMTFVASPLWSINDEPMATLMQSNFYN